MIQVEPEAADLERFAATLVLTGIDPRVQLLQHLIVARKQSRLKTSAFRRPISGSTVFDVMTTLWRRASNSESTISCSASLAIVMVCGLLYNPGDRAPIWYTPSRTREIRYRPCGSEVAYIRTPSAVRRLIAAA